MLWNALTSCANSGDQVALNFLSVTETTTSSSSKETSPISVANSKVAYCNQDAVNVAPVVSPEAQAPIYPSKDDELQSTHAGCVKSVVTNKHPSGVQISS